MRVELRNSGGETCPECGSHGLVVTTDAHNLEADLLYLVEAEVAALESATLAEWEKEKQSIEHKGVRAMMELQEQHEQELTASQQIAKVAVAESEAIERRVEALLGERASWYRPFKRVWQKKLRERVEAEVESLRQLTRKA